MQIADPSDPHPAGVLSKRDFYDRVFAASDVPRALARPVIDATLAQLGRALAEGQTLAVAPLGRCRISTERDSRGVEVITLRLRRKPATSGEIA